jgi:predicted nucleic acid-binding protein
MTRPRDANGMGFSPAEALATVRRIRRRFPLLAETPEVYSQWQRLAARYGIVGRQVYDTRLVAVMHVHQVSRILTLNAAHFRRFDGITVLAPDDIA